MTYDSTFQVRWADLDPNFHLKNTAYSEYATQTRFAFLDDNGVGMAFLLKSTPNTPIENNTALRRT